ncbi:MAG TPA: DUF58 domain-containing protein [Bryobacteraceae bacterium]|nr:DUF58 domain-containing protein [Bryobacteraceae bacterium]
MAQEPLIRQPFLEKLERLTLHWQKSFPGLVGGRNPSRFSGAGQEFLDHRHFHQGDDLRAVNWRAYMRLEKLFLKMFQVEPRIPVRLLLDVSKSMATGAELSKFDYARKLAAALSYVGLVRLDTITLQPFTEKLAESFRCGGGRHRFMPAVNFLSQLELSSRTDYLQVSRQFAGAYPQPGLTIIISDFLTDGEVERPLQYLSDFGHELLLVHVWAPEDREPPWDGEMELIDSETGDRVEMNLDADARAAYTDAFDAYARRLQTVAHRGGGRYVGLRSDTSLEEAIFGPLMRAGGLQ